MFARHRSTRACRPFSLTLAAMLLLAVSPVLLPAQATSSGEPEVVRMDVRPVLRNAAEAERYLDRFYPPLLKEAGVEGVAGIWIRIDELGRVRETRLQETSGYVALDDAAEKVAQLMSFEPAERAGAPIAVWIPMDIAFRLHAADEAPTAAPTPAGDAPAPGIPAAEPAPTKDAKPVGPPAPEPEDDVAAEPTFTPMTVRPQIQNAAEVQEGLASLYPPALRDAGIDGRVSVWLFIDANGAVQDVRVNQSSGYDAFDAAALQVARIMRFSPAENSGERVPVWVATAINFEAQ